MDATGNQVTVIGDGNTHDTSSSPQGGAAGGSSSGSTTSGEDGTVAGNQTGAAAIVPVDASGNQVTVIGDGNTASGSSTGPAPGSASGTDGSTTSGTDGTGSGNQTNAGAAAPVDATGNQVTVIGDGNTAENTTTEGDTAGATDGNTTSGQDGTGSGNQTEPAITAPVDAGDNQVTVIGDGNTAENTTTEGDTAGANDGDTTSGQDGTGSGNQTVPGIVAPVDASDNQITVLGDDNTTRDTESSPGLEDTDNGDDDGVDAGDDPATGNGADASDTDGGAVAGAAAGSAGNGSNTVSALPQAGPTAQVAGVLPQTGAAAGLVLWGGLGLMMLLLGLGLLVSQRRTPGVRTGREVAPVS